MTPYVPSVLPIDPRDAVVILQEELEKVSASLLSANVLTPQNIEPPNKQTGMLVYTDASVWDPGSGAGVYVYTGSAWSKL